MIGLMCAILCHTLRAWQTGVYKESGRCKPDAHEPSSLHTRRLKSQHHENSSSTSTTTALSVSCTRTLRELHPPPPTLLPLSCSWALASLFLWVVRLYSSPPSARVALSRLAHARSATPSRPCYRQLGVKFAVGENLSPGYGRFLRSLHFRWRLPSQTRTRLPIVSTVIGSTPPLPLQVSSRCSVTATIHSLG